MCAGAYVARPAVPPVYPEGPPTVDDVPPGWNLNWPFPGPYPPGYAPTLTLPMTATETIRFFGTTAITGEFRDNDDFVTNEPDAVIITATIGDVAVNLRFSGDTEYASSISSDSTLGDYWIINPDIEFELSRRQEGAIVVLTGTSAVDGITVIGEVNVAIYLPIYSLVMSGPEGIQYDEAASITVSFRDHDTLETDEPIGCTFTWTATLDGVAVGLRFSGDPAYSSSISSSYSDIGDYWGAEKSIEFDLDEDDVEKTITLTVEGTIFEEDLLDTIDISIDPIPYPVSFVTSLIITDFEVLAASLMKMRLKIDRTPTAGRDWPQIGATEYGAPPPTWWEGTPVDTIDEITSVTDISGAKRIDASGTFLDEHSYTFSYDANEGGNATISVTWSMIITMSDGTVRSDESSFTIEPWGDTKYATAYASRVTDSVYLDFPE